MKSFQNNQLHNVAWRGVAWRGVAWRGGAWRGVAWRGVAWRGVAWRGVAWRGVAWRGVAWRGVAPRVLGQPGFVLLCMSTITRCTPSTCFSSNDQYSYFPARTQKVNMCLDFQGYCTHGSLHTAPHHMQCEWISSVGGTPPPLSAPTLWLLTWCALNNA
jgi:hypothetical protein